MRRAHRCPGTAEPAPGLLRPSPMAKPPAIRPRDMMIWLPVELSALLPSGAVFLQRRRRRRVCDVRPNRERCRSATALSPSPNNAHVGQLDRTVGTAISVASFRSGTSVWIRPVLRVGAARTTMADLRHPLLRGAVPNSISLAPPHGVLVTGSNMSGKSTLLRAVGVNVVLAQTVHIGMATVYNASVLTVRSVIGRGDDLMSGTRCYRDELEAILTLVHCSRSRLPHVFLFDELFRGVITVERIAAGEAVLLELPSHHEDEPAGPSHIVIAATHDRELVDLLRPGYASYHFSDTIGSGGGRLTISCETGLHSLATPSPFSGCMALRRAWFGARSGGWRTSTTTVVWVGRRRTATVGTQDSRAVHCENPRRSEPGMSAPGRTQRGKIPVVFEREVDRRDAARSKCSGVCTTGLLG